MNRFDRRSDAVSARLRRTIEQNGLSYGKLGALTGIPKSAIHRYATGETDKIPIDRVQRLAQMLGVSPTWLMGGEETEPTPRTVPLLGSIACGIPILAEENRESEIPLPAGLRADFALRCRGDSMTGARIHDGDIVYIRQQEQVENGEIAAVLIGDEATLKRVYLTDGVVTLMACNADYPPMVFRQRDDLRVLGKAVGFSSVIG